MGIDIGYGFVKETNEKGQKLSFPALVAPDGNGLNLQDVFKDSVEYHVNINQTRYVVGDAARQSFLATQTMSREKPAEIHDPLLLTAAHLLCGEAGDLEVGVGLPLAYYASQKSSLKQRLADMEADVVIGGQYKHVRLARVEVYPQGAGILLSHQSMLTRTGYVGLVDIGTYTTEYLLFEMKDGRPIPLLESSGSVEAGVHLVHSAVARDFQHKTGSPLPLELEASVTERALRDDPVLFEGKNHSFRDIAIRAQKDVALALQQKILSSWGNRTGHIQLTLLAGGGACFFREDLKEFPCQHLIEDPFYANAKGYLDFLS